ncbi:MAG: MFS transporter [Acidimicrobiales bacterium]
MHVPVRLYTLLHPSVSPGVLLAVAFSTFVLGASPFLFGLVSDHYGVGLGLASLVGVAQMLGFVVGSWGAGRFLVPRRRVFVVCLASAVVANLASGMLPPFPVLIALRLVSGLGLGLISWFAWVQVFGDEDGMGDVAVIGPVAGIIASPLIALFARGGVAQVFTMLGVLAVVPLVMNRSTGAADRVPPRAGRSRPVPVAVTLLICLGLFTIGGSSVFQFAVVLGRDRLGLDAGAVSWALSANAVAAIPATRWPYRRGLPGPWMAVTGACALALTVAPAVGVFVGAIVVWGFAFWMGVPGVFTVLADRSAHPADRAGDAQAVMAAGRVIGPVLGGVLLDAGGALTLGLVGSTLMVAAGAGVFAARASSRPRPRVYDLDRDLD